MRTRSLVISRWLMVQAFVIGSCGFATGCSRMGATGEMPRPPTQGGGQTNAPAGHGSGSNAPAGDDVTQCFDGAVTYYSDSLSGRPTASGEPYDPSAPTAAHRTLPFGTWLRVERSGRTVMVRVNDRGPYASGVVLDVSRRAAETIDLNRPGRATAKICVVATRRSASSRR